MRENVNATRQLHCQWWCGQWQTFRKRCFGSQHLIRQKSSAIYKEYLTGTGNWNNKLVSKLSALKLSVCSKINGCPIFVCVFFQIYQTWTSNFRKVVWQYIDEGEVGSIIWILLEIYFSVQQWNDFENPLRIDRAISTSLVY